jgi:hypothetical protein
MRRLVPERRGAISRNGLNHFATANVHSNMVRSALGAPNPRVQGRAGLLGDLKLNELLGQMCHGAGRLAEAALHESRDLSPTYAEGYGSMRGHSVRREKWRHWWSLSLMDCPPARSHFHPSNVATQPVAAVPRMSTYDPNPPLGSVRFRPISCASIAGERTCGYSKLTRSRLYPACPALTRSLNG